MRDIPLVMMRSEAMATWYHCSSTIGFWLPQLPPSLSPFRSKNMFGVGKGVGVGVDIGGRGRDVFVGDLREGGVEM
jgi:hypothetical protein